MFDFCDVIQVFALIFILEQFWKTSVLNNKQITVIAVTKI